MCTKRTLQGLRRLAIHILEVSTVTSLNPLLCIIYYTNYQKRSINPISQYRLLILKTSCHLSLQPVCSTSSGSWFEVLTLNIAPRTAHNYEPNIGIQIRRQTYAQNIYSLCTRETLCWMTIIESIFYNLNKQSNSHKFNKCRGTQHVPIFRAS